MDKGIDHILQAQYPTGGWASSIPGKSYHRHINNDDATVRLLNSRAKSINPKRRIRERRKESSRAQAFDRGRSDPQMPDPRNGKLTAWRPARSRSSPRPGRSLRAGQPERQRVRQGRGSLRVSTVKRGDRCRHRWSRLVDKARHRRPARSDWTTPPKGTNKVVIQDPPPALVGPLTKSGPTGRGSDRDVSPNATYPTWVRAPQRLRLAGILAAAVARKGLSSLEEEVEAGFLAGMRIKLQRSAAREGESPAKRRRRQTNLAW